MAITGDSDGPPAKVGVAMADLNAGLYATVAVLGVLFDRMRGGAGRDVEVSLLDAQVASLLNQSMNWLGGGVDPTRLGSAHPNLVPYQAFATATGHIVVAVGSDEQFRQLCDAVAAPEIGTDDRFATNRARVANREELVAALADLLATKPSDELLDALRLRGVPAGPVRSVAEVFDDPFVADRVLRRTDHEQWGAIPQVASPFRIDGATAPVDLPPPTLGAHDDEVRAATRKPSR